MVDKNSSLESSSISSWQIGLEDDHKAQYMMRDTRFQEPTCSSNHLFLSNWLFPRLCLPPIQSCLFQWTVNCSSVLDSYQLHLRASEAEPTGFVWCTIWIFYNTLACKDQGLPIEYIASQALYLLFDPDSIPWYFIVKLWANMDRKAFLNKVLNESNNSSCPLSSISPNNSWMSSFPHVAKRRIASIWTQVLHVPSYLSQSSVWPSFLKKMPLPETWSTWRSFVPWAVDSGGGIVSSLLESEGVLVVSRKIFC